MKTFAELLYFPSSSTSRLVLTSCDTGSSWCFTVGTEMFRLTSEVVFSFTSKAIFSLTPTFTELCGDYQHVDNTTESEYRSKDADHWSENMFYPLSLLK